jgi:hypothetical protein
VSVPKLIRSNDIPSKFDIKLRDVLVLYYNLYKARAHPSLGFQDAEETFSTVLSVLDEQVVQITHRELEGLLWASTQLEEVGAGFWHPHGLTVNVFITRMIHHKKFKFYFDKIYNFFRARKPKQGIPPSMLLTSGED